MTNNGENWSRGTMIGKGCSGSVFLAFGTSGGNLPAVMAAKSAELSSADSIRHEAQVLFEMKGCHAIIEPIRDEITTTEKGEKVYNLLLEFASGGCLSGMIQQSKGHGLREEVVRGLTRSIVEGLRHVHKFGYVHRDIKPENILLMRNSDSESKKGPLAAKIADFGLARKTNQEYTTWRGTVVYLPPEALISNEQDQPSDIWSLGCVVLEMLTGKAPWDLSKCSNGKDILKLMVASSSGPEIPAKISSVARDFLRCCLATKTWERSTAEQLLSHPFVTPPQPSKLKAVCSSLAHGACFRPTTADHSTARPGIARVHPASGFGIARMQAGR